MASKYVVIHGGIKLHLAGQQDPVHVFQGTAEKPTIVEVDEVLASKHPDILEPLELFKAKQKAEADGKALVAKAKADAEAQVAATLKKLQDEHNAKLAQKGKG